MADGAADLLGSQNAFLASSSEEGRQRLMELGEVVHFEPNSFIVQEGDAGAIVMLPLDGKLSISKTTERGRRQVICQVDPTSCGGLCMLLLSDPAAADVMALSKGSMLVLSREDFQGLARQDPHLCHTAWSAAAECLTHFSTLVETLSFHTVSERVARSLLEMTSEPGEIVYMTQAELAALVGTTREVVARCLAGLQTAGAIRLGRGRITVLNRDALAAKLSQA